MVCACNGGRPMKTYLSIDLDFWNHRSLTELEKVLLRVKEVVEKRELPFAIVDQHHRLVRHIDRCECERVINMDYHSDIVNKPFPCENEMSFNCGSWANFVRKKLRKEYVWLYPKNTKMKWAYCHWPQHYRFSPFHDPSQAGWESVRKEAVPVRSFPWDIFYGLSGIGLAMSYEYLEGHREGLIRTVISIFGKQTPNPDCTWGGKHIREMRSRFLKEIA